MRWPKHALQVTPAPQAGVTYRVYSPAEAKETLDQRSKARLLPVRFVSTSVPAGGPAQVPADPVPASVPAGVAAPASGVAQLVA